VTPQPSTPKTELPDTTAGMTPTPTEASQEDRHVTSGEIQAGLAALNWGLEHDYDLDDCVFNVIETLDQYRQEHRIVPSYLQEIPPEIADDVERTVRSIARTQKVPTGLFRFKDKDTTNE
jgi:hypothetical protein